MEGNVPISLSQEHNCDRTSPSGEEQPNNPSTACNGNSLPGFATAMISCSTNPRCCCRLCAECNRPANAATPPLEKSPFTNDQERTTMNPNNAGSLHAA